MYSFPNVKCVFEMRHHPIKANDGDIIKDDVKISSPLLKVSPNQRRHLLSLRDELGCVVLRLKRHQNLTNIHHNALQHFVHNRRKHALIKVDTEVSVNGRQSLSDRFVNYTKGHVDHLKILNIMTDDHSVPRLPVNDEMLRGRDRTSKIIGR